MSSTNYQGKLHHTGTQKIGIVVARFNELITKPLLEGAMRAANILGLSEEQITIAWVPGAFEIPLVSKTLAQTHDLDAVIALGAVIQGGTDHYTHVCNQASSGIAQVSLELGIPVLFEVLTVNSLEQGLERCGSKAGNKGYEAMLAAVEMTSLMEQIHTKTCYTPKANSRTLEENLERIR